MFEQIFNQISTTEGVKKVFSPTKDCKQFTVFFHSGVKVDANEKSITIYPKKGSDKKNLKTEIKNFEIETLAEFQKD